MGYKSRSAYSTGLKQCFKTCKCPMCKRLKINGWSKQTEGKRKEKRKMKMNKGFTELGVLVVQAVVIAVMAVGNAGVFSSDPTTLGFNCAVQGLTAYSQMPHVKRDFREKKAVAEFGYTKSGAQALSDEDLLAVIRDNEIPAQLGFASGKKAPDFTNISKTRGIPAAQ